MPNLHLTLKVGSINYFQEISRLVLSRLLAFMKE